MEVAAAVFAITMLQEIEIINDKKRKKRNKNKARKKRILWM
jgi:hypothetical protein